MEKISSENIPGGKNKFPIGMKVLLIYLGYVFIVRFASLWVPILFFGPFIIPTGIVFVYYSISILIIVVCFWSIIRRINWGRKLIIAWFGFSGFYVFASVMVSLLFKTDYLNIYKKTFGNVNVHPSDTMIIISALMLPLILAVTVSAVIIWYVYTREEFFIN